MPFDDDVRTLPVTEVQRPLELAVEDRRLLATLSARLSLPPESVVRVALLTLAQPPRGRRW
jgi:hypothetical protein